MKCPKCELVTFDHLAQCPRCQASFARQRRLTRRRRQPDRTIVIPRPAAEGRETAEPELRPRRPIAPPEPERPASEPGREVAGETLRATQEATELPEPTRNAPLSAETPHPHRQPRAETTREGNPTPAAPRPPTADQHAADAAGLKEKMIRAGQIRRAREQDLTGEIDPILPDWYEPSLDEEEETDAAVATSRSGER